MPFNEIMDSPRITFTNPYTGEVIYQPIFTVKEKCKNALRYLSIADKTSLLQKYILDEYERLVNGYPLWEPKHRNCAIIINSFKRQAHKHLENRGTTFHGASYFDVNAQEFFRRNFILNASNKSDPDSGSSSDSDKSSDIAKSCQDDVLRRCARCKNFYPVNKETGEQIAKDTCVYHPGKRKGDSMSDWDCCNGNVLNHHGCSESPIHVWSGATTGHSGPLPGFVSTLPPKESQPDGVYGIYAIDCEMSFTLNGLELVKVTVIDFDGCIVYNEFVKPDNKIIDYNTRFSGIVEKDLLGVTKSLRDVQKDLLDFISSETILIGHGLENDLKALKIIHKKVIDTSLVFRTPGYPHRHSLKNLAKHHLFSDIQINQHDPLEDARTVVDLMYVKLCMDIVQKERWNH